MPLGAVACPRSMKQASLCRGLTTHLRGTAWPRRLGVPETHQVADPQRPEIGKVANTADMKAFLGSKQGLEVQTNTPEQFAAFIRSEIAQNAKLAKLAGIKPE